MAFDAKADDLFGRGVSISGDYLIVGARYHDAGGMADAGAAYVFRRTGGNIWESVTKITASDAQAGDQFGWGLAISGTDVIVGAHFADSEAGAAYIFE